MNARKKVIVGSSILALFAFVGIAAASGKKKTTDDKKPCRLGYHRNAQGKCVKNDGDRKCGDDMMWSAYTKKCVPAKCPNGYRRRLRSGDCVKISDPDVVFCPDGQKYNQTTQQCEPTSDDRCAPGQVRNLARLRLLTQDLLPSELIEELKKYPLCVPTECPDGTERNAFGECVIVDDPKKPDKPNEKCIIGYRWVGPSAGMPGRCIKIDEPIEPIKIDDYIKDYPEGNSFYQVKYGDVVGWSLAGLHENAISQSLLGRELFLAAREFGGLDNEAAMNWSRARRKNKKLTNELHNMILCCAMNDAAYGTWGYCGKKAKDAGRCTTEQQHASVHGRAIRLLSQHADNAERLRAGLRMARTVSILKPGDAGNGKSNPVAPAQPGGDNSFPLLWMPGVVRERLWQSNGTQLAWNPSQANPPGWITSEGIEDYSGSLETKYGCNLSNYNGEVEFE